MPTLAAHSARATTATLQAREHRQDRRAQWTQSTSGAVDDDLKQRREAWARACERYARLAHANPFFGPLGAAVQALANGRCADVAIARVDGVDLHLARPLPAGAVASADAVNVQLRALTGGALELRCLGRVPRVRTRVRVVAAEQAAAAVEECLHELGWIPEGEWRDWR